MPKRQQKTRSVSTNRVLQPWGQHSVEAQESHLRVEKQPNNLANHLAETLQQPGMQRLTSEPNVFKTATGNAFILVYVDDLLFLGEPTVVNKLFADIQQQLLLLPTGDLTVIGDSVNFLGRITSNKGDYYEISLASNYTTELLKEADMLNCNSSPAPGTKATSTDFEQPLTAEEHKAYRRAVGKLQWMTYTRPDISYATKELARSLTQPTALDQQKLKHLLRHIKGTQHYRFYVRPLVRTMDATPDLNVFMDSVWAGCATTRKSMTEFVIQFMGSTIHYGSRTQATIALSSAEAELYTINVGAAESPHIRNVLQEAPNIKKINIRIHTVRHDLVRIVKINTANNIADIVTKYVATETLLKHLNDAGLAIQHR